MNRMIGPLLAASILAIAACGEATPPAIEAETPSRVKMAEVPYIVAAAHPLAVDAGVEVLEAGGSAVDAAIAVQAVLGLVEPQSSGLAGGAFMLFYDASSGDLTAYDGRETAPLSAHPEIFLGEDGEAVGFYEAVTGGYSVGVPGVVAMLDLAHRSHGELAWSQLFQTAERLADDGFPMPQRMNASINRFTDFQKDPQAAIYLNDGGAVKEVGEPIYNPPYAESMRILAAGGAAAFYSGPIAQAIIGRVNEKTGENTLTLEDFAAYEPIERDALCATVAEHKVCSMPPPSAGGTQVLATMGMFEALKPGASPSDELLTFLEASRLAYADRQRYLADPVAMGTEELTAEALIEALIAPDYLSERAQLISDAPLDQAPAGEPMAAPLREGRAPDQAYEVPSTSHFSIRDRQGNVVSMTTSVEFPLGSQMMAAGMVLNNQLTDFSRVPEVDGVPVVNAPAAGKRPLSSMSPVIAFNDAGQPVVAIGSPGGTAIPGYVVRPLLDYLMTGKPLSQGIVEPHVLAPRGSVYVENGNPTLASRVKALGYEISERNLTSGLYGFTIDGDKIDLVVDPRREGSAVAEER